MENYFVPYVLALRMKALGFDEPCFGYYTSPDGLTLEQPAGRNGEFVYFAPLYQQAFRWFRDNHRMFHEVFIDTEPSVNEPDKLEFAYLILHMVGPEHMYTDKIKGKRYDTYEESELACLERLIEIIEEHEKGINI